MRTRSQLLTALLALASAASALAQSDQQTPAQTLAKWLRAMDRGDYVAYLDCIATGARSIPEYGSREALRSWTARVKDLGTRGFAGEFKLVPVTTPDERHPAGAVRAFPVLDKAVAGSALVLVQEAGAWRIAWLPA